MTQRTDSALQTMSSTTCSCRPFDAARLRNSNEQQLGSTRPSRVGRSHLRVMRAVRTGKQPSSRKAMVDSLVSTGGELAGAGTGSAIGSLLGEPGGAAIGAASGIIISKGAMRVLSDVADRFLSERGFESVLLLHLRLPGSSQTLMLGSSRKMMDSSIRR